MSSHESPQAIEPLDVPGKYYESVPLDVGQIPTGANLGLFGGRYGGKWHRSVHNFTGINHIPRDENMPPQLGEIVTDPDPHPLESARSYDFAHSIARGWLTDRGLNVERDIPGARLYGSIVCSTFSVTKPSAE